MDFGLERTSAPHSVAPYRDTEHSIEAVAQKMREARHDVEVRRWAIDTLASAGFDGRTRTATIREAASALLGAVRSQTTYIADPAGTEWVQSAKNTLCLGDAVCLPGVDCDDSVVALGGAILSIGFAAYAVVQDFGNGPEHVLVGFIDESGKRFYADASNTLAGVYEQSEAISETWIDPLEQVGRSGTAGPELVMLGNARDVQMLGGVWQEKRYGKHWVHDGARWHPSRTGLGAFYTPGDVLAFRQTWDAYVLGIVKAAQACGALWAANDPSINVAQFATPPDATTKALWGNEENLNAQTLLTRWNKWANTPDWQIIANAEDILQDLNATVQAAGQYYAQQIRRDCPSVTLPDPPGFDLQAQVIGRLEGLGIVAHGALQLLGIGASGALEAYGAIPGKLADVGKKVADLTPWIVAGVIAVAGAYVVSVAVPLARDRRRRRAA